MISRVFIFSTFEGSHMDGHRMRHSHVEPPGDSGIRRIGPTFHFGGNPDFPLLRFLLIASRRLGLSDCPKATLKQFLPKNLKDTHIFKSPQRTNLNCC